MTAMLHCLVGDIVDEIGRALPGGWAAANDDGNLALIETLSARRLLDERGLMALLLRRADEERIAPRRGRAAAGAKRASSRAWSATTNGAVSAAAMALILARGQTPRPVRPVPGRIRRLPTADGRGPGSCRSPRRCARAAGDAARRSRPLLAAARDVLARPTRRSSIDALTAKLVATARREWRLEGRIDRSPRRMKARSASSPRPCARAPASPAKSRSTNCCPATRRA